MTSAAAFTPTRWSVVLSASTHNSPQSSEALEILCRNYWRPLYAFVRRQGYKPHDAQDLTQAFFARLLEKNYLTSVVPAKGKFRSFLLAALKHFLANEWDKASAQKRGGGHTWISLDEQADEVPAEEILPEPAFERRWATTLLNRTLARLHEEYRAEGKGKVFEQLKGSLTGADHAASHASVARQLQSSEGAIKVAVHRLRRRYRDLLRAEIADTVADPSEIEEELRHLFAALGG